ncbi:MAG: hypothetical protein JXR95_04700 [Deltaproteobacteria bacterium]|nr:hypothetical protein [Deltaproteobacteria bacterium]
MKKSFELEREYSKTHENIIIGRVIGTRKIKGQLYHHIQFGKLLCGSNRYLDIFIPDGDSLIDHRVFAVESSKRKKGRKTAVLLYEDSVNLKNLENLLHKKGTVEDPFVLFNKELSGVTPGYPFFIVTLGKDNLRSAGWFKNNRGETQKTVYSSANWTFSTEARQKYLKIKWIKRSRVKYFMYPLGYIFTVPLDIITSPFQIFMAMGAWQ